MTAADFVHRLGAAIALATLVGCASIGVAGRAGAAPASPAEWLPADNAAYEEIELLRTEGLLDTAFAYDTRPRSRHDLAQLTAFALRHHPEAASHPGIVRLWREFSRELVTWGWPAAPGFTPSWIVWAPGAPADSGGAARAHERVRVVPYLDVAFEQQPDGDSRLADHSRAGLRIGVELGPLLLFQDLFAGRIDGGQEFADPLVEHTDFIHYTEDTYLSARAPWIEASLGRQRLAWGPGDFGSMLWSETAEPATTLQWGASLFGGRLRGSAVHGDVDAVEGARIAAHRLEFALHPRLSFGVAEAARYSSAQWEPLYVVSVIPYTLVQRMLDEDTAERGDSAARNNVMASLDLRWRATRGLTLYGELLLDDLTFRSSGTPVRIGYQAGALAARTFGARRGRARFEYARVHRYVYAVYYGEDFVHHNEPIGYPTGPDARRAALDADLDWGVEWSAGAGLERWDQGEGTLGESFDPDGPPASGSELSGVVESATRVRARAAWRPRDGVEFGATWGYEWRDDADHVAGASGEGWFGRLRLFLRH